MAVIFLPADRETHQKAMLAVSLQAGHFRPPATGMYCGSLGHKLRPNRNDSTEQPANKPEGDSNDEAA